MGPEDVPRPALQGQGTQQQAWTELWEGREEGSCQWGGVHAGTETLSTLDLTADPQEPITTTPRAQSLYLQEETGARYIHITYHHLKKKNRSQGHKRPVATCTLLPSHGASGGLPSPKSSQSTPCPSGSRAEKNRKPCPSDQHQSMCHGS